MIFWQASRAALTGMMLAGTIAISVPASAQSNDEARLRKMEAEIRALQRQVFPNGDNRFFTPEVVTQDGQRSPQPNVTPSSSAVSDILVRLQSIESQLARLTAASEVNANALAQLEERVEAIEEARAAAAAPPPQPTGIIPVPGASTPAQAGNTSASESTPAPAASGPSPERVAAVQAIAKPATDDAGDDEYSYGFRLWEAGFYPEAQQQLALFLEKYPDHWRATYGRNLLGRAYLDAGKPREAAPYFLENYQADPLSARAPDSLLYLAEAMIAIDDTRRACLALAEFGDTYPALATGRLQAQYDRNRSRVTCS